MPSARPVADQSQVIPTARGLLAIGARGGAALVLFNAAIQRHAAERADATQWSIWGRLPDRRQAAEHLNPANDEHEASDRPAPIGTGL